MDQDMLRDGVDFQTDVKRDGKSVPAVGGEESQSEDGVWVRQIYEPGTVSSGARQLRHLFLNLQHEVLIDCEWSGSSSMQLSM